MLVSLECRPGDDICHLQPAPRMRPAMVNSDLAIPRDCSQSFEHVVIEQFLFDLFSLGLVDAKHDFFAANRDVVEIAAKMIIELLLVLILLWFSLNSLGETPFFLRKILLKFD